jgi:WD40 repeat protein
MDSFPHPIVRMGLDEDWTPSVVIQTYEVSAHRLSPSEDLLATGGQRERMAVYSIWDMRGADGETFIHPCQTRDCTVNHVSFDPQGDKMVLRTGCECGKLCRWDISMEIYSLLHEIRLESTGVYQTWTDDGSKVISRVTQDGESGVYRLSICNRPPVYHTLCEMEGLDGWQFSPGHGTKILRSGRHSLTVWRCDPQPQVLWSLYKDVPYACMSLDGSVVVCISQNNLLELVSAENGSILGCWDGIQQGNCIQFFPKGNKFILWDDYTTRLFDMGIKYFRETTCRSICISSDGQKIAVISKDGVDILDYTFEMIECHELNISNTYNHHFSWIHSILASVGDNFISFQHLSPDLRPIPSSSSHGPSPVSKLFLSPDNRHLLTLHVNRSLHLWDVKLGRRLHMLEDISITVLGDIHIEYAPDCSSAILREEDKLRILNFRTGTVKFISLPATRQKAPTISYSTSKFLAATFFSDSDRILIVQNDGNIGIFSLHNMEYCFIEPLRSPLREIRQLTLSPMEELFAICSDMSLIVYETNQSSQHIPLFSNRLIGAGFSPDCTSLYTLEMSGNRWMVSRVDTMNWTTYRAYLGELNHFDIGIWGPVSIVTEDEWSVLRFSFCDWEGSKDLFIDLSSGKRIIPPSSWSNRNRLQYGNQWLMNLPTQKEQGMCMNQYGLAYIHKGRSIFIDYSALVTQM